MKTIIKQAKNAGHQGGNMKKHGIKFPKVLAENVTTSRQKIVTKVKSQPSLFEDDDIKPANKIKELQKSYFSFTLYEWIAFDGICKLCMEAFNGTHTNLLLKIEKGIDEDVAVIQRHGVVTETHYRTVLSLDEAKFVFCGKEYQKYWPYVFENIKKLAYDPPKKKLLVLGEKLYIDTAPLMIDLIYEDGSSEKKLKTLSPKRTKEQKAAGIKNKPHETQKKIAGIAIEYYKPLFAPIIELGKNKKPGTSYIVNPPYFQLAIFDEIYELLQTLEKSTSKSSDKTKELLKEKYNLTDSIQLQIATETVNNALVEHIDKLCWTLAKISPLEMRNFYTYLALHDNHIGEHITIKDLKDFTDSCFPGLVETNRDGERKLYPSRYKELIEKKITPILHIYKRMTFKGNMNGGQLVPLKISFKDENTEEEFGRENNNLRIECMKSKSFFSTFTLKEGYKELFDMPGLTETPKMLGNSDCSAG